MRRPYEGRGAETGLKMANVEAEPFHFQFGCRPEDLLFCRCSLSA
jgi:hypothetical protein